MFHPNNPYLDILTLTFSIYVMLTSMLFIKHVGFKFNPVVAVDIESLYYILRLLKCTRDKEETMLMENVVMEMLTELPSQYLQI